MTLDDIRNSYMKQTEIHRNMFEDELINILKRFGFYDTDVILKESGKKGRLAIYPNGYSRFESELKFIPYKKDGTLSKNIQNIWGCTVFDYEQRLPDFIEKA